MSAETHCPQCERPLPEAVVSGPAQAVVRCEGCASLLLWSNGRVVRAARPGAAPQPSGAWPAQPQPKPAAPPPTSAPKPAAPPPATSAPKPAAPPVALAPLEEDDGDDVTRLDALGAHEPPLTALKPEVAPAKPVGRIEPKREPARTVLGMPAVVPPGATTPAKKEPSAPSPIKPKEPSAPVPVKPKEPSAPIATRPKEPAAPIAKPKEASAPIAAKPKEASAPVPVKPKEAAAPIAAKPKEPTAPLPVKPKEPAAPLPVKPREPTKPSATKPSATKPGDKPQVVAAVAEVNVEASGPLEDPSEWFEDQPSTERGQTIEKAPDSGVAPMPRLPSENTGPVPLPPPPGAPMAPIVQPFDEHTPPLGSEALDVESEAPKKPTLPVAPPPRRATVLGVPTAPPPAIAAAPPTTSSARPAPVSPPPVAGPEAAETNPDAGAAAFLSGAASVEPPTPSPSDAVASMFDPGPDLGGQPELAPAPQPDIAPPLPTPNAAVLEPAPRSPKNKRNLVFAGIGAGALALLVGIFAVATHGSAPPPKPAPTPSVAPPPDPAPAPEAAKPPAAPPSPPPAAEAAPPEPAQAAADPEPTPAAERAAPAPHGPRKTLGGKKVVLEYDPKPTSPEPPAPSEPVPAGEDPRTLARAREAYHKGNLKLFAGDSEGALALYQEAIKIYPGYVAGYRGLGLAYAEKGNSAEALSAFKKYVATVPNARDVPLIRKRMEHLEAAKP
jgi:hypothetical protein